jgi:hypothetical protein
MYLLGPHVLNPHNIDWLKGDSATYYIGWALFRQDPHLHWPITFTDRIGYPIGDSISMMDVNPLFAVILKPFAKLLSDPFQYFGLEAILACALQFFFSLRLFRLILGPAASAVVLPSLFLLVAPPLTLRMSGHYALTNQWMLIAALLVFCSALRTSPISMRRFVKMALILGAVSVSINPYLAIQVLFVLTTAVIALVWRKRMSTIRALVTVSALGMTAVLTAYIFGFIVTGDQSYQAGGYRYYSMNLLSPLDPNGYGALFLPQLPHFSEGQYEGYCYLGAGVILLAIIAVFLGLARRPRISGFQWRSAISLLICCAVLMLMALSTEITAGTKVVVDLDPSQRLTPYLSIMRSSGRLFWTPYYVLVSAVLVAPYLFLRRRWANILLVLALSIQMIDLIPLRRWLYSGINLKTETPLKSTVWSKLGANYKNLIVLPAWQCGPSGSPGGGVGFETFGMLAATEKMRTNSYYSARPINHGFHCDAAIASLTKQPLAADSVYVVTPGVAGRIISMRSGACHNVDGFVLCSSKDNLGLGHGLWESETELWIRDHFKTILGRDPTQAEEARWVEALDRNSQATTSLLQALLSSDEFERQRLPEFWAYVDAQGRWPTLGEWLNKTPPQPATASPPQVGNRHLLHDRNRAFVCMLYFAVLERDPDPGGLSVWSGALARTSLQNVIAQFLGSPEYASNRYLQNH